MVEEASTRRAELFGVSVGGGGGGGGSDAGANNNNKSLSSVRQLSNYQTVTSHLDRCAKRRRSFEEQVFADTRRWCGGAGGAGGGGARLLSACLGAITAFSQDAKKWTGAAVAHRARVAAFFRSAEMHRLAFMRHQQHQQFKTDHSGDGQSVRPSSSSVIAYDANLYDQFIGEEVDLFETGSRLVQEREGLVAKSTLLLRSLELPCPMGAQCVSRVRAAREERVRVEARGDARWPRGGRRDGALDDDDTNMADLSSHEHSFTSQRGGNASHRSSATAGEPAEPGRVTHADVRDHAVACWVAKFTIENMTTTMAASTTSSGSSRSTGYLGDRDRGRSASHTDHLLSSSGLLLNHVAPTTTRVTADVHSGQDCLWQLLARCCPTLVARAYNAPARYVGECVADMERDDDELARFYRASGMAASTTTTTSAPAVAAAVAAAQGRGAEQASVRVAFIRTYDNEVVDGSTPVWKIWWLEFMVYVMPV